MRLLPIVIAAAGASLSFAAQAQDAAAGQDLFKAKCAVCHSLIPGKRSVGPSLIGVAGKPAGTNDPNFSYSNDMKNSEKTWDTDTLAAFLADPRGFIPGINMLFKGIPSASDRANLVAYIQSLK